MDKKINLKYANRNISLGEAFNFKKSKRAICTIDVLISIIEEALNEGIKKEMLIFAYKGKMYSIGYEETNFYIGLPDTSTKEFSDINQLKQAKEIRDITAPVTVLRELVEGLGGELTEVPVSSNVMLKEYLKDVDSSDYSLNISDEIIAQYENDTGTKGGIINIIKIIGTIIVVAIISGIIQAL